MNNPVPEEMYDKIYHDAVTGNGELNCPPEIEKFHLIDFLCRKHGLLVHGSNRHDIREFEPRKQTLFNGQWTEAVFATEDGIWSIFFAVLDRSKVSGDFRNACLKTRHNSRGYYYFSLTRETIKHDPWTEGAVYFLPKDTFEAPRKGMIYFDEWTSRLKVTPVLRLKVVPEDFPFLRRMAVHRPDESILKTILTYKMRLGRKKEL